MSQATLFDKIWDLHTVGTLETGETQLFIGLHLVHEVTSPQAFQMLEERGLPVLNPERTFATVDHIVPTDRQVRPLSDPLAEEMYQALERNVAEHGIAFFGLDSEYQGIVHVIGPELGLTQLRPDDVDDSLILRIQPEEGDAVLGDVALQRLVHLLGERIAQRPHLAVGERSARRGDVPGAGAQRRRARHRLLRAGFGVSGNRPRHRAGAG